MLNSVIVVDDEASIRTAVEQWLSLSGFTVQLFARAEECLAHLPRHFPGVIISDVRMPGMDGLQLLERLQADDPDLGLVAFVAIGMQDVSSCRIASSVEPGTHVAKGDELGHFQFGGSTYCLVFRPGTIADFALAAIPQPGDPEAPLVLVNTRIATVRRTTTS